MSLSTPPARIVAASCGPAWSITGPSGMTLREHYAGQIMAATISGIYASDQEVSPKATARFAVECADALLAALETQ